MPVKIILLQPMEELVNELNLEPMMELGPFDSVVYEDGWWYDGNTNKIAQVFQENVNDKMLITGHPAAGYIFVPHTFSVGELNHPDYPGKPYGKLEIVGC